jgi:hypothetical protein
MLNKFKEILNSRRFWEVVGIGIIIFLQSGDWKYAVITILTASVGIDTIDRFSKK